MAVMSRIQHNIRNFQLLLQHQQISYYFVTLMYEVKYLYFIGLSLEIYMIEGFQHIN